MKEKKRNGRKRKEIGRRWKYTIAKARRERERE
jgi:hypothetical protein